MGPSLDYQMVSKWSWTFSFTHPRRKIQSIFSPLRPGGGSSGERDWPHSIFFFCSEFIGHIPCIWNAAIFLDEILLRSAVFVRASWANRRRRRQTIGLAVSVQTILAIIRFISRCSHTPCSRPFHFPALAHFSLSVVHIDVFFEKFVCYHFLYISWILNYNSFCM